MYMTHRKGTFKDLGYINNTKYVFKHKMAFWSGTEVTRRKQIDKPITFKAFSSSCFNIMDRICHRAGSDKIPSRMLWFKASYITTCSIAIHAVGIVGSWYSQCYCNQHPVCGHYWPCRWLTAGNRLIDCPVNIWYGTITGQKPAQCHQH